MEFVTSADGSRIGYEGSGDGPPIVFVPGGFNLRNTFDDLATELGEDFSTVRYDRRGRGDSTDAIAAEAVGDYRIEREVEDLAAVLEQLDGSPVLFGFSSGAILALAAAVAGLPISGLALYEPPFSRPSARPGRPDAVGLRERLIDLIRSGRPGDAVSTFQRDGIGLPPEMVDQIRTSPHFGALEAIGQTTVYDCALVEQPEPSEAMRDVTQPTLVLAGAQTWPALIDGAQYTAELIKKASFREVPGGAGHTIPAAATADILRTVFR